MQSAEFLEKEEGGELVILVGLQAAGKSTFYQRCFAETHALVSKDLLRNNRRPDRRQAELMREALGAGRSVVVDNTNVTKGERAPLIALGREYGAKVSGYYFAVELGKSLELNRAREGKARVPDVAIFATLKRLERPTLEEGFDRLWVVRSAGEGKFEVVEQREIGEV